MRPYLLSIIAAGTSWACDSASDSAQRDLAFAYEYGYPLYAYGDVAKPLPEGWPTNRILNNRVLNTPGAVGVVRPNADTIYSIVMFDLSESDIVITVPEMPSDRYWVFPIYTPYGDDLVNIGNLGYSAPGKYLMQYCSTEWGLDTDNVPNGYVGVIKYPMAYGLSTMRILANRTDEDMKAVNKLQDGFNVTTTPRDNQIAPKLDLAMFNESQYNAGGNHSFYDAVLNVAAKLTPYNPTYVVGDREEISKRLHNAGFDGEEFTQPAGTNLTDAVATTNTTCAAFMRQESVTQDVGQNWTVTDEEYFGLYHSYYKARYYVGNFGYLGLTADQAVYPALSQDLDIPDGQAVMFTFSEPPKIKSGGFWSLTVYGPDQDLIENDLGRYSLGDQDELVFPDGSPVDDTPKEFKILLQPKDIEPPSNWSSNWLPINTGGGTISTTLRWYGSEDYMVNGSYIYPSVDIVDSIPK